jgi:3',5'-cyclic AMP phosphodiesterase CpdA
MIVQGQPVELLAISDLHVGFEANLAALRAVHPRPDAALVLAGDVGETAEHLAATLDVLSPRFRSLVWVPGNHELWSMDAGPAGEAKYEQLVRLCRSRGVLTPEDDYPVWEIHGERFLVVPMFLLYDYTFRPDHVAPGDAVAWAAEAGLRCADEDLLQPDPYPTREAWCRARCEVTERRIERAQERAGQAGLRTILINHFPLKQQLAHLPRIPRFQIWCGTRRTESWHTRYRAAVAISGHLHIRSTRRIDGCVFEEVSLGYPRQWDRTRPIDAYLRRIVPLAADEHRLRISDVQRD